MPNWKNQYLRYRDLFLNIFRLYKKSPDLKMFMELFLSLAAIAVFSVFALKPTILTIIELTKEINSKKETLIKMDSKIKNLGLAQNIYTQEQESIKLLDMALPDSPSTDSFAKQIEGITTNSSVTLLNFVTGETVLKGKDTSKQDKQEAALLPQSSRGVPFNLNFRGSYDSVSTLLNQLEMMRRPLVFVSTTFSVPKQEELASELNFTLSGLLPYLETNVVKTEEMK
jgi:hypothetical protein